MIDFDQAIKDELQKKQGQQPVILLEIEWVDGGKILYADSDGYPGAAPLLVNVGSVDRREFPTSNTALSATLDATDDGVRNTFDNIDAHMRPAKVYLGFHDVTERALLFDGVINSEVVLDEASRTLNIEILSKLEDSIVGFSAEDGNFSMVDPSKKSAAWPVPFGTVCHYPTVRMGNAISGFLGQGLGAADPTLPNRICQLEAQKCPVQETNVNDATNQDCGSMDDVPELRYAANNNSGGWLGGAFYPTAEEIFARRGDCGSGNIGEVDENGIPILSNQQAPDQECMQRKAGELCALKDSLARQQAMEANPFTVIHGEEFPQNQTIDVRVGSVIYRGRMVGNQFHWDWNTHPDAGRVTDCRPQSDKPLERGTTRYYNSNDVDCSIISGKLSPIGQTLDTCHEYGNDNGSVYPCMFNSTGAGWREGITNTYAEGWRYYDQMPSGRFVFHPPGTEVSLVDGEYDIVYIASLLPGIVLDVAAYRTFGDKQVLTRVPTTWYQVHNVNYGGYEVVELRFKFLPSQSFEEGWSDDIYVSFQSRQDGDQFHNPVDIIKWAVENYTDYSVDTDNFDEISPKLEKFPCNFVLLRRMSVLQFINDVASQSRIGVNILNGVVKLTYLPEEPTPVRTLGTSDMILGSFRTSYTRTEDLVTNYSIDWQRRYTTHVQGEDPKEKLSLKYNIPKYGSLEGSIDWYTSINFEIVHKAATFKLIRDSHTWYYLDFETTVEHLDLDVLDSVTVDHPDFPTTKAVIVEKGYDPSTHTVRFRCWTPILVGTKEKYIWAWPSEVTSGKWPSILEIQNTGDGSGKTVTPPAGHPLSYSATPGEQVTPSAGDPFPSDVGFSEPPVVCPTPLGNEILYAQVPPIDPVAKASFQNNVEKKEIGSVGGQGGSDNTGTAPPPCVDDDPCFDNMSSFGHEFVGSGGEGIPKCDPKEPGDEKPENCQFTVRSSWLVCTLTGGKHPLADTCWGGCGGACDNGCPGVCCNGYVVRTSAVFGSASAACKSAKKGKDGNPPECSVTVGAVIHIGSSVTGSCPPPSTNVSERCEAGTGDGHISVTCSNPEYADNVLADGRVTDNPNPIYEPQAEGIEIEELEGRI